MITLYYLISILFAFNEVYYVFNKTRLDISIKSQDVKSFSKFDILHYVFRLMFWIWIVIGLWSSQSEMFILEEMNEGSSNDDSNSSNPICPRT